MRSLPGLLAVIVLAVVQVSTSFAQSPGDTIGWTTYVNQSSGSTGRRVVLDNSSGLHFTWMWTDVDGSFRNVRYNCIGTTFPSPWPGEGTNIGPNASGYPQISVTNDDQAVVAFHNAAFGGESLFVARDVFQCTGTFDMRRPPNGLGTGKLLWPFVAVDDSNRIQVIATNNTSGLKPIGYTRSNNGGATWTALASVDTVRTMSAIVVSSKVSNKVAIVYCHPALTDSSGGRNNVYYVQSLDGITWDNFANKVNVTNYGLGGDSLFAWKEVSAVYDYNDNLHIIWNAQYVTPPINGPASFYYKGAHIYHWDATSNTIHSFASFDSTWPNQGCDMGQGNFVFSNISIAAAPGVSNSLLSVAYTSWNASDCSSSGYANGDIYLQLSHDNGATWEPKANVTNSQTPNCLPGNCASDVFPSQAEYWGDGAHIFFTCDRSGGQSVTYNPLLYFEWITSGTVENPSIPEGYSLSQNYPNPFNAQTIIKFNLPEKADIRLVIYDILGQKLTTLISGARQAGEYKVIWDAAGYPSGVYFARLETGEKSQSVKMVVLK